MEKLASEASPGSQGFPDARPRINLSWLLYLRWGAAAGQSFTVLVAWLVLGVDLPLGLIFFFIGVGAGSNLAATLWLQRARHVREGSSAALLLLDVGLLTGIFLVTGGPSNPFSTLYLVNIALAAAVLRPLWTWSLVAWSIACFGALFLLPAPTSMEAPHGMHGLDFHFEGMFVAFAVSAVFIAYFVRRVTGELADREAELAEARHARARAQRIVSLGTLAAGAAHELATPLSTIAVVARELERKLEGAYPEDEAAEDARLVREQVDRCRKILDQMSADAGGARGESFGPVALEELLFDATADLSDSERVVTDVSSADARHSLVLPRRALAQALRAVAENALEASGPEQVVRVSAAARESEWRIEVADRGPGMNEETLARVGEPFFTTKGPERGMGLGLFLAQSVLADIGGSLSMRSRVDHGTTVELRIPTVVLSTSRRRG